MHQLRGSDPPSVRVVAVTFGRVRVVRIGVKAGQWGWTFDELVAAWTTAEAEGFDVLSCFDHVSAVPGGGAAWDAPTLLAAMAGATSRIRLAVHVLNVSLRPALLLAGQLAVAQASSDGRLEVGLGTGSWHLARHDHRVAGVPFPPFAERVRRLEACCGAFPALWRGETISEDVLGLDEASLGPLGIEPPPIVVGGTSERVLAVAAAHADGWNASSIEPERFAQLEERVGVLSRDRALERQVQIWLREVGLDGARDARDRYEAAGADTLIFVLDDERDPDVIGRLAAAVCQA
jgi:alkanesulfonate monooxygenase SsuD/methylene tetrahydromethanopterin reductase-like flavin-dependent oxidoreductase (luciferase family)